MVICVDELNNFGRRGDKILKASGLAHFPTHWLRALGVLCLPQSNGLSKIKSSFGIEAWIQNQTSDPSPYPKGGGFESAAPPPRRP